MLNGWDGREGRTARTAPDRCVKEGCRTRLQTRAIEMTPDHAGLSHSGLEACCDERLGIE